ncbi:hypothetical protein AVI51_01825 [Piscirickettsia salmonis]|uniref:Uncharacterized protein n=1 Tax=Piscirickettsia salmonis TaxID=1238 RepID=A0A9Q5VBE9_PISSA|nr:hypothetical protein [Piscirickettsia salmonis]ALA24794.1 phosphate ABC transporter substrate-binding protein [Piscirickettsia salmonis]APS45119.1 hypothetical protein AVI48_12535 [Piscirickettsia salmonis]APS48479.1 hypothetical protein AVI49_13145 [Piscirickettsia salmonis]APS49740.1 hypothetical protein AVI50_01865 [Piscirickettsia salmonis]APS52923.1 hypothetical protein AVI51_01825 [Piscirickettsia salmonis]
MKHLKTYALKLAFISFAIAPCSTVWAQSYEVIVNPINQMQPLSKGALQQLFLKQRTVAGYQIKSDGNKHLFNLIPIDNQNSESYQGFYLALMGWGISQVNTYWNNKRFSGSSLIPQGLANTQQVINYVAKHQAAISYIPIEDDSSQIRALQIIQ